MTLSLRIPFVYCPVFLTGFYTRLWELLSTGVITLFYETGHELKKNVMIELKRRFKNPARIFSTHVDHCLALGMGKIDVNPVRLLKMTAMRSVVVRIRNNFLALAVGKTRRAECHMTRGYLADAAEFLTSRQWMCEENKCLCKSDSYCEFKLKLAKRIQARGNGYPN
jgi:predicted hydrocarbon binding protein